MSIEVAEHRVVTTDDIRYEISLDGGGVKLTMLDLTREAYPLSVVIPFWAARDIGEAILKNSEWGASR